MFRTAQLPGRPLFWFGLTAYLALHVGYLQLPVLLHRSLPVEPDDAYSYILKAAQYRECRTDPCPAVADLRRQLTATSADSGVGGVQWIRNREAVRILTQYHPLHSVLLVVLHMAGASWEGAYQTLWLAGSVFVGCAVAAWLWALVGPGGAGLALLALAAGHFQEQGLDYPVPSTLSMSAAMLSWAVIAGRTRRHDRWLPLLIASTIALHQGGVLWSGITVSAFLWLHFDRSARYYRIASVSAAAWVLGVAYVLHSSGFVREGAVYNPLSRDPHVALELTRNASVAVRIAGAWMLSFGGGAIQLSQRLSSIPLAILGAFLTALFLVLCLLGWRSLERRRQRAVRGLALCVGAVTLVTVCYVMPGYPAPLFVRSWVFLAVLGAGLAAQGVWTLVLSWPASATRVLTALLLSCVAAAGIMRAVWGFEALGIQRIAMMSRGDLEFDARQVQRLREIAASPSTVLYLSETPLYFYLSHGGNRLGAVYYPAVANTSLQDRFVTHNDQLRFVVGFSPAAGVRLSTGDTIVVSSRTTSTGTFWLRFGRGRGTLTVTWRSELAGAVSRQQSVALDADSWVAFARDDGSPVTLRIASAPAGGVRLAGLRHEAGAPLNWPWGDLTEMRVSHENGGQPRVIRFDPQGQMPISHGRVEVIDDRGDTFLARLH